MCSVVLFILRYELTAMISRIFAVEKKSFKRRNVFVPTLKWCFYCYKTMVFLLRHKMVFQMRRHVFAVSIPSLIFPIFAIILNFMFLLFQMRHSFSSCYSYTYMQNLYFHEIITISHFPISLHMLFLMLLFRNLHAQLIPIRLSRKSRWLNLSL